MGIVSGFVGGAGKGMAIAGQMAFADKLAKEREEVSFMRDSAFKTKSDQTAMDFKTSEREAGEAADIKSKGIVSADTKYTVDNKPDKAPQLIKYTDSKGMEQEGILQKNADGSFNIVKPGTDQIIEEEITSEELKNMAAKMNADSGAEDDWIPFNEVSKGDAKVRAAVMEEKKKGGKGGIVKSATGGAETPEKTTKASESPYEEGQELTGPGGKIYVVKNGKPVLKKPQ